MSYTSGFFDAVDLGGGEYDREYSAAVFAHYFSLLVKNGVFPDPSTGMQVKASSNPDMHVSVQPGSGWINGYYITVPDDNPEVLTVPIANPSLSRIDSVIMGLNFVDREIQLYIKSGAVSASPIPVSLQRDNDLYELELAQISVSAGVASIVQANITDMRQNTSRCGIVKGTIEQIDTTDLFAQYDDAFQTWFNDIKDQLSENVATNLQNQINQLKDGKADTTITDSLQAQITSMKNGSESGSLQNQINQLKPTTVTKAAYGLSSTATMNDILQLAVVSNSAYVVVVTKTPDGVIVPSVPVTIDGEFVGDTGSTGIARFSTTLGTHVVAALKTLDMTDVSPVSQSVSLQSSNAKQLNFVCTLSTATSATVDSSQLVGFSGRVKDFDICVIGGGGGGVASIVTGSNYNMSSPGGGGGHVTNLLSQLPYKFRAMNITIGSGGKGGSHTASSSRGRTIGGTGGTTTVESKVAGVDPITAAGGTSTGSNSGNTYLTMGGSGGSGGGGARSEDYPYVAGDGGQDGSDGGGKASNYSYGGTGQGTTTKAFGDSSGVAYAPGGGGAYTRYSSGAAGTAQSGGSAGKYVTSGSGTISNQPGTLYGAGGGGLAVGGSSGTVANAAAGVQGAVLFRWRFE